MQILVSRQIPPAGDFESKSHLRRIFTPIARPTGKWQKAYNLRTSVERVNSRIDQVLGFEHHTIRGKDKQIQKTTGAPVRLLRAVRDA